MNRREVLIGSGAAVVALLPVLHSTDLTDVVTVTIKGDVLNDEDITALLADLMESDAIVISRTKH